MHELALPAQPGISGLLQAGVSPASASFGIVE
jgi:hypothetical protein